jgi:hypothetical protein
VGLNLKVSETLVEPALDPEISIGRAVQESSHHVIRPGSIPESRPFVWSELARMVRSSSPMISFFDIFIGIACWI